MMTSPTLNLPTGVLDLLLLISDTWIEAFNALLQFHENPEVRHVG